MKDNGSNEQRKKEAVELAGGDEDAPAIPPKFTVTEHRTAKMYFIRDSMPEDLEGCLDFREVRADSIAWRQPWRHEEGWPFSLFGRASNPSTQLPPPTCSCRTSAWCVIDSPCHHRSGTPGLECPVSE